MAVKLLIGSARMAALAFYGLIATGFVILGSTPSHAQGVDASSYVQGEVLVKYRSDETIDNVNRSIHTYGREVGSIPKLQIHRIKLANGIAISDAIATLRKQEDVIYAEPNHVVHVTATPNDTYFSSQQWAPQRIQADLGYGIFAPQRQVIIAEIDSGVDSTHPDLANVMLCNSSGTVIGYNAMTGLAGPALDDYGHGTHCAGIAAAQVDNGIGIAGIAGWNGQAGGTMTSAVKIMPVVVIDSTGSGTDVSVASGIMWAVENGANVITMSLGEGAMSTAMLDATNYAWSQGCVVVAAAGNSSTSAPFYPAANPNVLSVAATDPGDNICSFSDYGSWVSVAAPGWNIYSTIPTYTVPLFSGLNYGTLSGTSMAAPHVAAEAALIMAQNSALTNAEVYSIITGNVDPYVANSMPIAPGSGRINVYRALQAATAASQPAAMTALTLSPSSVFGGMAVQGTVTLSAPVFTAGTQLTLTANSSLVSLPATVTVPPGVLSFSFNISTSSVVALQTVTITATFNTESLSQPLVLAPITPGTATFVKLDTTTSGNWQGVYGSTGYMIQGNSTALPSFATASVVGATAYIWNASDPTDTRCLLKAGSTTDRIAACWYSATNYTIDLPITDGNVHQIALYGLDFDRSGRDETIQVIDMSTGTVLDTETLSAFQSGKYLVWNVSGSIQINVTNAGGTNAALSGIFLDPVGGASPGPASVASLASVSVTPATLASGSSGTGTATLTTAATAATTVALATTSSAITVPASVVIPVGQTSATFAVTANTVTASTSATLTATLNSASVNTTLTVNPVVASTASASFVMLDATTSGNWTGVYGSTGYIIEGNSSSRPTFAAITVASGTGFTWNASDPTDTRCLLKAGSSTDRIASCWYTTTNETFDVPITDGNAHQIALYGLDFDKLGRTETVQVIDPSTGKVLDTETLSAFQSGKYLVWNITGHVQLKVTNTGPVNAVISGVFLDPVSVSNPVSAELASVSVTPNPVLSGASATGTVTLSAAVSTATTVTLSSSSSSLTVPASVTIPAGSTSVAFTATAGTVTSAATATVTATVASGSVTATVTVNPLPAALASVSVTPNPVLSGASATGTVTLSAAVSTATTVTLSSSSSSLTVPASVTIPAGSTSVAFTATAGTVTSAATATVTATVASGSVTATVTVNPPLTSGASASFVKFDTTTSGNWQGVYGSNGCIIEGNSSSLPTFAAITVASDTGFTWNASDPTDTRCLLKAGSSTDRIASCWYTTTNETFDVPITDGNAHQIALYGLDFDKRGRDETVQVIDPSTGNVLDTETLSAFQSGKYLVWKVTAHVQFKVTNAGGLNAVISGIFID